jgi:ATP-dependent DNA ligase
LQVLLIKKCTAADCNYLLMLMWQGRRIKTETETKTVAAAAEFTKKRRVLQRLFNIMWLSEKAASPKAKRSPQGFYYNSTLCYLG